MQRNRTDAEGEDWILWVRGRGLTHKKRIDAE
jgi:hypothetical protein